MTVLLSFFAGLLGLAVGSFLNVVAHRVPLGKSILRPPSACPGCDTPISARDNLPLVGWLLLRGHCRSCAMRIPVRYPLLELAGGVLWVVTFLVVGLSWILPAYLWFVSVTLVLFATDLEHHRLPNRIVFVGFIGGLVLLLVGSLVDGEPWARLGWSVAAGFAYFCFMLVLALLVRGGFGFGDVKMAVLLGLFVGYQPGLARVGAGEALGALTVAVFGSFLVGGLVAVALLALRKRGRKQEIAFGPAMIVASWVAVVVGNDLFRSYLEL